MLTPNEFFKKCEKLVFSPIGYLQVHKILSNRPSISILKCCSSFQAGLSTPWGDLTLMLWAQLKQQMTDGQAEECFRERNQQKYLILFKDTFLIFAHNL